MKSLDNFTFLQKFVTITFSLTRTDFCNHQKKINEI